MIWCPRKRVNSIQRLPDDAEMEEIIYRLYVLENVRRGQRDAAKGNTQPAEGLLDDIHFW